MAKEQTVSPRLRVSIVGLVLLLAGGLGAGPGQAPGSQTAAVPIDHIVVIFMENRSFDHLFGAFPGADGRTSAAAALPQADKQGAVYATLPQALDNNNWPEPAVPDARFPADLPSDMFDLGRYVPPTQITGDPVHEYY